MMLYEILKSNYYQKLEEKDRIFNKLQFNCTFYITIVTIIVYMVKNIDYSSNLWELILFFIGIFTSFAFLMISMNQTRKAFTGYQYPVFPSAVESVNYHKNLNAFETERMVGLGDFDIQRINIKVNKELDSYVIDFLAYCIDKNHELNELRRALIRRSMLFFFYASIPLFLSSIIFIVADLDVASPRKNLLVEDEKLRSSMLKSSEDFQKSIIHMNKELSNHGN